MRPVHYALISLLFPSAAQAVITARVDEGCPVPTPAPPPVRLDVWLDPGVGDTTDERLNRFVIKLDLLNASPDGVRFAGIEPSGPFHPPLFPGMTFEDLGSDYDTIFVSGALPPGQGRDISDFTNGLFTTVVTIPPVYVPFRLHPILIDPAHFGFFDASGAPVLVVPSSRSGGIHCIPEPSAGLVLFFAIAAFGRPRSRPV